jgi:DNA polymerase-3 subunit gamma/tau
MTLAAPAVEPGEAPNHPALSSFEAVVALATEKRDLKLKHGLERYVRLVRFEDGRIQMGVTEDTPPSFATELGRRLGEWTGRRWIITIDRDATAPTIHEQRQQARAALEDDVRRNPVVSAVMDRFPGSKIVDIRVTTPAETADMPLAAIDAADDDDNADEAAED